MGSLADFAREINRLSEMRDQLKGKLDEIEHSKTKLRLEHADIASELSNVEQQSLGLTQEYARTVTAPNQQIHTIADARNTSTAGRIKLEDSDDEDDDDDDVILVSSNARSVDPPAPLPKPSPTALRQGTPSIAPLPRSKRQYGSSTKSTHPNFPTVINIGGRWYEIKCCRCQANASPVTRQFYNSGMGSVRKHAVKTHNISSKHDDDTIERREISDEDIALMARGEQPKVPIIMNFGPGAAALKTATGFRTSVGEAETGRDPHISSPFRRSITAGEPRQMTVYEEWQNIEKESRAAATALSPKRRKT